MGYLTKCNRQTSRPNAPLFLIPFIVPFTPPSFLLVLLLLRCLYFPDTFWILVQEAFRYSLNPSSRHGFFLFSPFTPISRSSFLIFHYKLGVFIFYLLWFVFILFLSLLALGGWFSKHKLYEAYESLCFSSCFISFGFICPFVLSIFSIIFSFSFLLKYKEFSTTSFHIILGHHQLYRAFRWGFLVI